MAKRWKEGEDYNNPHLDAGVPGPEYFLEDTDGVWPNYVPGMTVRQARRVAREISDCLCIAGPRSARTEAEKTLALLRAQSAAIALEVVFEEAEKALRKEMGGPCLDEEE